MRGREALPTGRASPGYLDLNWPSSQDDLGAGEREVGVGPGPPCPGLSLAVAAGPCWSREPQGAAGSGGSAMSTAWDGATVSRGHCPAPPLQGTVMAGRGARPLRDGAALLRPHGPGAPQSGGSRLTPSLA